MSFINDDFLLKTPFSRKLYHQFAAEMPVFDYHCHLPAREIYEDRTFRNMTDIWLGDDHYKWRAMRLNGIDEEYVTGGAGDREKFFKWAEIVPSLVGNPLFHWTHLELKRYFGIDEILSSPTAEAIWETCNKVITDKELSPRKLIKESNVSVLCTTDDPVDDLEAHRLLREDAGFEVEVLPTFRPDRFINIESERFEGALIQLEKAVGYRINDLNSMTEALYERMLHFKRSGCFLSDHALDELRYSGVDRYGAAKVLDKKIHKKNLSDEEVRVFKSYLLHYLGTRYSELNWAMQLHIGALRNTNRRKVSSIGESRGYDGINDMTFASQLSSFLDDLDSLRLLPKTILYNLNPRDNYVMAALSACFQEGTVKSKVQFGSGWWFCDQKDGMTEQMKALANLGILSAFIGMLTDSRSFLSYSRHEYFRRILCAIIGNWVEEGEYPEDLASLGKIVQDICFNNAMSYFSG